MNQQVLTSGRGSLLVEQGGLGENIQVYFVVLRIFLGGGLEKINLGYIQFCPPETSSLCRILSRVL